MALEGVVLPETIEKVAAGMFGTCIVFSEGGVLKLFRWFQEPENEKERKRNKIYFQNNRRFFLHSVWSFNSLAFFADQITRRGITLPELIRSGKFSSLFKTSHYDIDDETFRQYHAWQLITKLDGKILSPRSLNQPDVPRLAKFHLLKEMTQVAIKIHIPARATYENQRKDFIDRAFRGWFSGVKTDRQTKELVKVLHEDILRCSPEKLVRVHGDFNTENVMKNEKGKVAVLDWDSQTIGNPARDIAWNLSRLPKTARQLTEVYNSRASVPVNPRVVIGWALASRAWQYFDILDRKRRRGNDPYLKEIAGYIVQLAQEMHKLTGKQIYADYAKHFSKPGNPLRRTMRNFRLKEMRRPRPS